MPIKIFFTSLIVFISAALQAQSIKYTVPAKPWNADSLGNHRAVVNYTGNAKAAKATIEWRRQDEPAGKRIIVEDAKTGKRILNVKTGELSREKGTIYFEPVSGTGTYYVYYLSYKNEGRSNYPKGVYLKADTTADAEWASLTATANATCAELQSVDAFNSFFPMEVIATQREINQLKSSFAKQAFLVFPEDREYAIRMEDDLPQRWIQKGVNNAFNGRADKGEHYSFQLGVYALKELQNITIAFSDFTNAKGQSIAASAFSCVNTNGTAYNNQPLKNTVNIAAGKVQAMWCLAEIPANATAGVYKGKATIKANGEPDKTITVSITVSSKIAANGNIEEPWKMTRLHWLNSTLAQENTVIQPYTPLLLSGDTAISLLGRKVLLNKDGFPRQIQTFFNEEMTGYQQQPNNLLYEGIHFHLNKKASGKEEKLKSKGVKFTHTTEGTIEWEASNSSDSLQMNVHGSIEFDGFMQYKVALIALQDMDFSDIVMHIPFMKDKAMYMMGLGEKGGLRNKEMVNWKWDVANKNQDGAWIGNVNAGIQFSLRDEKYVRPLNTNFYLQKPLLLPASWGNENKGGIDVGVKGSSMLANSYSGPRSMKKGDTLYYNFNLLITPFHPINTAFQWDNKFYHRYDKLDDIKSKGATVINIHHATAINPWINYPFIEWKKMKGYVDSAHQLGLKVKIYNTVRELSNRAYETFALRSLGHEVYSTGKGGGFSWLQEHVKKDYIAAWFVPEIKDAAIVNSGMNRWHNYYVEGMNWLAKNVGIDGIYLDDVAFDRITMKRIKRVLTQDGKPGIIDLHSANQYNKSDGFNNSAMLYMEHFPYLNRLWFGEYFDYEKNSPDFFLTEVSGIPFGLMGEMLQDDGNPWRGMLYGMTSRLGWSAKSDPRPLWKAWDELGIKQTEMVGYWSSRCPVKTNNDKVLATVYKANGKAIVSLASWADADTAVQLQIDWKALGLDEAKASISAPAISNFQAAGKYATNGAITIEKGKGLLLEIK